MVVRRFISADALPVDGFGRELRVGISLDDLIIATLRLCPVFSHDRHTRQSHFEIRAKLFFRQIAFESPALVTVRVRDQNGRGPKRIEAVKVFRILFDVNFEGDKVLVYEGRKFRISV